MVIRFHLSHFMLSSVILARVRVSVIPVCVFHQIQSNPMSSPRRTKSGHAALAIYDIRSTSEILPSTVLIHVAGR
jgi:hypothetical protein